MKTRITFNRFLLENSSVFGVPDRLFWRAYSDFAVRAMIRGIRYVTDIGIGA